MLSGSDLEAGLPFDLPKPQSKVAWSLNFKVSDYSCLYVQFRLPFCMSSTSAIIGNKLCQEFLTETRALTKNPVTMFPCSLKPLAE